MKALALYVGRTTYVARESRVWEGDNMGWTVKDSHRYVPQQQQKKKSKYRTGIFMTFI